jgi:hypothetical protein
VTIFATDTVVLCDAPRGFTGPWVCTFSESGEPRAVGWCMEENATSVCTVADSGWVNDALCSRHLEQMGCGSSLMEDLVDALTLVDNRSDDGTGMSRMVFTNLRGRAVHKDCPPGEKVRPWGVGSWTPEYQLDLHTCRVLDLCYDEGLIEVGARWELTDQGREVLDDLRRTS